jgi:hypothetical protein
MDARVMNRIFGIYQKELLPGREVIRTRNKDYTCISRFQEVLLEIATRNSVWVTYGTRKGRGTYNTALNLPIMSRWGLLAW